jgi:hypothetical protein
MIGSLLPAARDARRGFWIAALLSLCFLVLTFYQSAATLVWRIARTDVMDAAMEGTISGSVALELVWFVFAVLMLHLAMGAVAWALACASAAVWPRVREKFGRYVVGWFALLAIATVIYSALWYPRTLLGAYYNDILSRPVAGMPVGRVIYLAVLMLAAVTLCLAAWRVVRRPDVRLGWRVGAVATPIVLVALVVASVLPGESAAKRVRASQPSAQPNVIIIGIDSLRLDRVRRYGGTGETPNIDAFLQGADLFRDTTTPLGRTFPSWTAILTGRSPKQTGARYNLTERSVVASYPTIGDLLRKANYHTVFSMDESRFANIDESYGFDQIVSPRMGAPDFILGTYNELPLSSVVIDTRLGKQLFPYSYANRGAATMYHPASYIGRLEREVSFDRPTLLITHLTGAHWPYYTAGTPYGFKMREEVGGLTRPLYDESLRTVDRMFGDIVQMLEEKGALDNAIVVILSDHGEALDLPNDTFIADGTIIQGLRAPIKMTTVGHGQSVLSPSQYHVLLGFRAFGPDRPFEPTGRDLTFPASVEDISPTLLDLLGRDAAELKPSGRSLAPLLREGGKTSDARYFADRIRFTETDLKVLPAQNGVDENATAEENAKFFKIDSKTGRMHIRANMAPLAIAFKERAAFTPANMLAAIPAGPDAMQYLYFDLKTGNGKLLLERPTDDAESARLWDALVENYGGEMKRAVAVTQDDWPAIDDAWSNYLSTLQAAKQKAAEKQ